MNPLIKLAAKSTYDKIMSGKKPDPDPPQEWCKGRACERFRVMGSSCNKGVCNRGGG